MVRAHPRNTPAMLHVSEGRACQNFTCVGCLCNQYQCVLSWPFSFHAVTAPKAVVTQFMREPSLIEEPAVAIEIQQCILVDDHYGPICDSIKQYP